MPNDNEFTPTMFEVREAYSSGDIHAEAEFDRMIAAVEAAVRADQIERLNLDAHFECNCAPELGPPHCHACGEAAGRQVPWAEAVHGPMPDRKAIRDAIFGGDQYGAPDRVLALLHGEGATGE